MKALTIFIVILIILGTGYVLFTANTETEEGISEEEVNEGPSGLIGYFAEEMFTRGTADGLIPIEGFDAGLLMGEFPGLVVSDFSGVEAFEGVYGVENGELTFDRVGGAAVSSAERTVSEEGYGTLLENLSARLNHPTASEVDVDALLDRIQTE